MNEHHILVEVHGWGDDGRAFCSCGWSKEYRPEHMEHRSPTGAISYIYGVDAEQVIADHAIEHDSNPTP